MAKLNFKGKKYPIVEKYKIWFAIPILIILLASIIFTVFAIKDKSFSSGLNIGIDFTGGSVLTIPLGDDLQTNYDDYISRITRVIEANDSVIGTSTLSGDTAIVIRYKNIYDEDAQAELNERIKLALETEFDEIYENGFTITTEEFISIDFIGSSVSKELVRTALLSVAITTVLILLYIIIRFEWLSGVAAVVALLHDVLMIFAFTIIFRIQINSSFVAAIITIVAYSINNTIVIFDRVRENMKIALTSNSNLNKLPINDILNDSVTNTLNRSLNTTITTIFTVSMIAILGVSTIREFALPLIFGLLAGTFSSIFLAPSIYSLIRKKIIDKKYGSLSVNKSKA